MHLIHPLCSGLAGIIERFNESAVSTFGYRAEVGECVAIAIKVGGGVIDNRTALATALSSQLSSLYCA
jgi:hypothetical protein